MASKANGSFIEANNEIVEVWAGNLESVCRSISYLIEKYQYVAIDTEFPGIVARPSDTTSPHYNYRTVKCNVDLLKVIQLGITFSDASGKIAQNPSTWQFNFKFDMDKDMYAQDSIDFLIESGVNFNRLRTEGIDPQDFGELIMSSGLVMNDDIKWISFHGCYDFGYFLKLLTCSPLPEKESRFFELLADFFPSRYDIKYLLRYVRNFHLFGGYSLERISNHLDVPRVGKQHTAGSDSLVTCNTFFKLLENYFGNELDESLCGIVYGLGSVGSHHLDDTRMSKDYVNGGESGIWEINESMGDEFYDLKKNLVNQIESKNGKKTRKYRVKNR